VRATGGTVEITTAESLGAGNGGTRIVAASAP